MAVGLFIPCYIDQFYPDVAIATLEILERHGLEVAYPASQTCCGQPMANSGCVDDARPLAVRFLELFGDYEYVVAPSGSCVSMVKHHYEDHVSGLAGFQELKDKTYELCEFMTDVLCVETIDARFPYRVGLHESCHGLRELRMGKSSEVAGPNFSKTRRLLEMVEEIELCDLQRPDECCGFGGTFAINEEAVSCLMGLDRLADHEQAGTQVITATDMSCLMHLGGLISRQKKPIHMLHIAQILAGGRLPGEHH
ncbi:MAG: (Fe-S)-binding protein [Candidatus Latescibacteria bacterium]|jgi:L-lactate dehydrogenase complex protein LldE|nr:(Fe-S)-binding protein [Candidatus Latescibacterota bacterium]